MRGARGRILHNQAARTPCISMYTNPGLLEVCICGSWDWVDVFGRSIPSAARGGSARTWPGFAWIGETPYPKHATRKTLRKALRIYENASENALHLANCWRVSEGGTFARCSCAFVHMRGIALVEALTQWHWESGLDSTDRIGTEGPNRTSA